MKIRSHPQDILVCWYYRLFYCSQHGHRRKPGLTYCANCGKKL